MLHFIIRPSRFRPSPTLLSSFTSNLGTDIFPFLSCHVRRSNSVGLGLDFVRRGDKKALAYSSRPSYSPDSCSEEQAIHKERGAPLADVLPVEVPDKTMNSVFQSPSSSAVAPLKVASSAARYSKQAPRSLPFDDQTTTPEVCMQNCQNPVSWCPLTSCMATSVHNPCPLANQTRRKPSGRSLYWYLGKFLACVMCVRRPP